MWLEKRDRRILAGIEKKAEQSRKKLKRLENIKTFDSKHQNLLLKIKREIPNFNEQELLEFTCYVIPNIHYFASHNKTDKLKKYCSKELIAKFIEQKNKYRITTDIDNIRIEYMRLEDCINKKHDIHVRVYCSVFFYDKADNNIGKNNFTDKYWNDIWIVTFKENKETKITTQCPNCGAPMKYSENRKTYDCEYCRNSVYNRLINWKITDIEVK